MQALFNRELYGEPTALQIESMGSTAVSIANRWTLGWKPRVLELLSSGRFLQDLRKQIDQELDVLANETALTHLSSTEILAVHGVPQEPPGAA